MSLAVRRRRAGRGGEIQLTDALPTLAETRSLGGPVHGVVFQAAATTPGTVSTVCVPLSDSHANVKIGTGLPDQASQSCHEGWSALSSVEQAAASAVPTPSGHGPAAAQEAHDAGTAAAEDPIWSVPEHLADILAHIRPLEPLELRLLDAQGCVLAEDVTVAVALPPFDNSSMDGYAVRTADVEGASEHRPAVLTVIGDVAAGSGELPTVGPGEAARIMTGAPLPPGADAVVPVEWTDGGTGRGPATTMRAHSSAPEGAGGEVRVYRPARAGQHIRLRGSDVQAGDLALEAGTVLGPSQIGLLAAIGRSTVTVRPRPRVVVMSTGSELVQPGEELTPGRIHDSNSFALTAAARDAGAIAYRAGAVADDAESLRAALEEQLAHADLIVTSGGVSVGAYDVVKETLSRFGGGAHDRDDRDDAGGPHGSSSAAEGGRVEFRKLAMQPGKPQGFGRIGPDRTPLLALPGNPVSAYVSFELFVRPAIRALMGLEPHERRVVRARLEVGEPLTSPAGKRQFLRGRYEPPTQEGTAGGVAPVGGAGSHLVAALAHADALIVIPEDTTEVEPGAELDAFLLG